MPRKNVHTNTNAHIENNKNDIRNDLQVKARILLGSARTHTHTHVGTHGFTHRLMRVDVVKAFK